MIQARVSETQDCIEQCLRNFLSKEETVYTLEAKAKIPPDLTSLVWDKMEELHPDFFRSYKVKRRIADSLRVYNNLQDKIKGLESRINTTSNLVENAPAKPLTRNAYQNAMNIAKEKAHQHQNKEDQKENQYPNMPIVRGSSQPAILRLQPLSKTKAVFTNSQTPSTLNTLTTTVVTEAEQGQYPVKPTLRTLLEAAEDLEES